MNRLAKIIFDFYVTLINILNGNGYSWNSLDELVGLIKDAAMETACRAAEAMVDILNDRLFTSCKLARSGWRRKERTEKRIHTSIGDLCLWKDTYQNRESHKCVALLFEALGITPHQRTSQELMYSVLEASAGMSFSKAIATLNAGICVQTAINWLRSRLPVLERTVQEGLRCAKVLHVFLDEDHLAMMKDHSRKHMILPVGAVAEGHTMECEGRYRLINPFYFTGSDLRTASLTDAISGYICQQYDMNVLQKIYVHGDGAGWICKALEEFCGVEHVLDGFHFERAIRRCCRRFGKDNKRVQNKLRKAITADNMAEAENLLTESAGRTEDAGIVKKTGEFLKYLKDHWDAIRNRISSCPLGSCTEALVQHVASERFSSTPHGWSRPTITKLAALRTFLINGGTLSDPSSGQPAGTHAGFIDEAIRNMLEQPMDFSIFEKQLPQMDGDSGTQHLIDMLNSGGHLHIGQ